MFWFDCQLKLTLFKKIDDWEGLSHNYFEIGNTYKEIGDYSKSLEYTKKGLSIVESKDLVKEVLMYTNCINISLSTPGL